MVVPVMFLFLVFLIGNLSAVTNTEIPIINRIYPQGIVFLIILVILSKQELMLEKITSQYVKLFVALNFCSILIWLTITFNFGLSYDNIHLGGRNDLNYRNYYNLGIFCDWTVFEYPLMTFARNGGMFEEPGMLGTSAALLLGLSILYKQPQIYNWILVLLGITSLSMAFFILCFPIIIYLLLRSSVLNNIKLILLVSSIIGLSFPFLKGGLLYRLGQGGNLLGISRESDIEKTLMLFGKSTSTNEILFGSGIGANKFDQFGGFSGIGSIIYEYGLFGFILFIIIVLYTFLFKYMIKMRMSFLIYSLPVISLIQRYDFTSACFCIYWVSSYSLKWENKK